MFGELLGDALVVGGTIYVIDKVTGKRKKVKVVYRNRPTQSGTRRRTIKSPPKPRPAPKRQSSVKPSVRRKPPAKRTVSKKKSVTRPNNRKIKNK